MMNNLMMSNRKSTPDGKHASLPVAPTDVSVDEWQPASSSPWQEQLSYGQLLLRRKWALLFFALLGAAAGVLFTVPQTPLYRVRTSLEIQPMNENFLNMREVNPHSGAGYFPEFDLQTEVNILQSQSVLERVAAKLEADDRPVLDSGASRIAAWRNAFTFGAPRPVAGKAELIRVATQRLRVRAKPNTRLIEAFVTSADPEFAARFANTLVDEYVEQNLAARWKTAQDTGKWLTRQIEELKIELERAEDRMQNYARVSGLQFTAEKNNVAEDKVRQLQEELSRAQADRIAKQSRYELASKASPQELPEVLGNTALKEYQVKLADLHRQMAELSATVTPANPKMVKLDAQVVSLQSTLDKERANIVAGLRNEYDAARRREELLAAEYFANSRVVSDQSTKITHYNILRHEVDTTRNLYESLLQRLKEAGIASALLATNIRVVDRATPTAAPYSPSMPLNVSVGVLSSVLLGAGFLVWRQKAYHSVQKPGQTVPYLNVVELGVVPAVSNSRLRRLFNMNREEEERNPVYPFLHQFPECGASPLSNHRPALFQTGHDSPAFMESFRAAVTSILLAYRNGNSPRVLAITSAGPSEGKTTVTCNLAAALAAIGRRVLLIDGDLRKPRLHDIFHLGNNVGLSQLLSQSETPSLLALETGIPNLYVLPSGEGASVNLLYSTRLTELIEVARKQFDMVLIDTPPMLEMPDARVLSSRADAVILVVRSDRTTLEAAQLARLRCAEDGNKVLGTILNDWNPKKSSGYGYGYGYGYGKYGKQGEYRQAQRD